MVWWLVVTGQERSEMAENQVDRNFWNGLLLSLKHWMTRDGWGSPRLVNHVNYSGPRAPDDRSPSSSSALAIILTWDKTASSLLTSNSAAFFSSLLCKAATTSLVFFLKLGDSLRQSVCPLLSPTATRLVCKRSKVMMYRTCSPTMIGCLSLKEMWFRQVFFVTTPLDGQIIELML